MIIGLIGKIGSGKSTVAGMFVQNGFTEYALADPIKRIGSIFGFTDSQLYGSQEDKLKINEHWGISGRTFMQIFGTEVCKEELPKKIPSMTNVWIRLLEIYVRKYPRKDIVISDIRFLEEALTIKQLGGVLIRIDRPGMSALSNEALLAFSSSPNGVHISETESDGIKEDYVISNTNGISELIFEVEKFLSVDKIKPRFETFDLFRNSF